MLPGEDVLGQNAALYGRFQPIDNPAILKTLDALRCIAGQEILKRPFVVASCKGVAALRSGIEKFPGLANELFVFLRRVASRTPAT